MNTQILLVLLLTFIITLIGTLAYATRIVGVRTGRIAVSLSLFNIFVLISRTASNLQAPLLTKYVEAGTASDILPLFKLVLLSGCAATVFGALLFPTFQRLFHKAVLAFSVSRSVPRLVLHSFSTSGIRHFKDSLKAPSRHSLSKLMLKTLPIKILLFNIAATALISVSVLAPIYAGSLVPELRATCITLSGVVNGLATILLFVFIDPYLSVMTDDVIDGKSSEEDFKSCIVGMVVTRIIGTFASFFILVPAAQLVVIIAQLI